MRILYTADIHVNPDHLASMTHAALVQDVDALIVGGDIIPHQLPGRPETDILAAHAEYLEYTLIPALKRLRRKKPIPVYLDLGNDDFMVNRTILENQGRGVVHLLHMQRHALVEGIDLVGYMAVPPTPFARKDWEKPDSRHWPHSPQGHVRLDGYTTHGGHRQAVRLDLLNDSTIADDLDRLSTKIKRPFILVSHSPPFDTPLDLLHDGSHVGSLSIRRFIEHWSHQHRLIASLHGHIHESPQVSGRVHMRMHNALCINPGQTNVFRYVVLTLNRQNRTIRIDHATA